MSARDDYDQERIVRHSEVHDDPTASMRAVPRERRVYVDADRNRVVEEDAVLVERPAYRYNYDTTSAVSENVEIDRVVARRALLERVSDVVWFAAGILEVFIGLRVVFRLLEANEASGFVNFVYGVTEPFVRPFQGIFSDPTSEGAVLDSAALLAMVVWALVAWALVRLIWMLFDRPESGVRRSVRETRSNRI